jgi:predicted ATPase/class 3 adenylate cyclase
MRCPSCNYDNLGDAEFCERCGAKLELICPTCKTLVSPRARFCKKCGSAIGSTKAAASTPVSSPESQIIVADDGMASEAIESERKIVSVLFADLEGSTTLMEDLDPEAAHAVVAPLLRIMTEVVQRYEGYVARTTGDGIFALFGAPVAYEDHPQRALYAALEMQRELRAEGRRRAAQGLRSLEARIGTHTGEVVAYAVETSGKVEYRLIGHTANLASRLEAISPVGSIATSDYTRRLCAGYFELRELGPTRVKGLSTPIEVYEVIGPGQLRTHFQLAARRGLTRFVGRERELEQMRRALELAMSGHGQVVAVVAEAGTGKSRLFHEFKATIPTTCKVLEAYSVSTSKASAWLPVLELLHSYFGIDGDDDTASRRAKVDVALTALDPALDNTLPYLFGLLGIVDGPDPIAQMDPQIKRQRTLEVIKRIVIRESLKQPVVAIFEDLHWIDTQTQALLDLLANSVASSRVLLLCNYRPEYQHQWTNKSYYAQLRLNPLGGVEGAAMLAALLGEAVELNPLKRLISERTGGNPFFIEEIVQALFDEGALVRNGTVTVARSLSQLRLPPTVQGMLAARIDRQPYDHKQLLQTLAVIGRESPLGLIRQVVAMEVTQLERTLSALQAGEFIYEQPTTAGVEYVFKHALTQDVAYNSLLVERRKQLHEGAGRALESMFAGQLNDHLSQLAHHYSHSDNVSKAVEYLGRAGQQAIQRSANTDAISSLTTAIELLQKLPGGPERIQRELPLQLALGQAFIVQKGWAAQEVEQAFTRALGICQQLGNPPEVFFALYGLYQMYHVRGLFRVARERAHQLLRLAESTSDPSLMVLGHYAVGITSFHTGELLLARKHQDMMLYLYDQERDTPLAFIVGNDTRVVCLSYAGWTLSHLGYPDQAVKYSDEAVASAQALSHFNSLATAELVAILLRVLRREPGIVQKSVERLITFSTEHGFGACLLWAPFYRGWAMGQLGRLEEGIEQMRQAVAMSHTAGADIARSYTLCWLAEGYGEAGRLDEALGTATEALAAADTQAERSYEAEIHRLRGDFLVKQNNSNAAEAENCFRYAIEIGRKQTAKSLELRATMSLARLLNTQGRRDEARMMLGEIYNWFTEGFDTADLKDAKALLNELAG